MTRSPIFRHRGIFCAHIRQINAARRALFFRDPPLQSPMSICSGRIGAISRDYVCPLSALYAKQTGPGTPLSGGHNLRDPHLLSVSFHISCVSLSHQHRLCPVRSIFPVMSLYPPRSGNDACPFTNRRNSFVCPEPFDYFHCSKRLRIHRKRLCVHPIPHQSGLHLIV